MFSGASAPALELVEAVFLPSRCASPALLPLAPLFFTDGPGSAVKTAPFLCHMPRNSTNRRLHSHAAPMTSVEPWRHPLAWRGNSRQMTLSTLNCYGKTRVKIQFIKDILKKFRYLTIVCINNLMRNHGTLTSLLRLKKLTEFINKQIKKCLHVSLCLQNGNVCSMAVELFLGMSQNWLISYITENSHFMSFWTCGKLNKATVSTGSLSIKYFWMNSFH